jgi:Fe-S-cluster containining protein
MPRSQDNPARPGKRHAGRQPWWHQGIRFECQGSGKCCVSRDDYGYVYLTLEDWRRLAAALGMPTRQFTRQYCAKTDGFFHLENRDAACLFLAGRRCTVYEARPTQCRTWPFWPENMKPKAWQAIADYCPGVGQGRVVPAETIVRILREQRRAGDKL